MGRVGRAFAEKARGFGMEIHYHNRTRLAPADRVAHLFRHRLGVDLPDVLTVALSSPAQSVMDVLTGEGLGDLDLAAVAVLAVPLWAIPADQRATVARLCEHP
jgi:hypothetical protein